VQHWHPTLFHPTLRGKRKLEIHSLVIYKSKEEGLKLTPRKYLYRVSIIRPALELPSRAHYKYGNYSVPVSRGQLLRAVNNSIRHSEIAFLSTL
jgi:hypothetical protein